MFKLLELTLIVLMRVFLFLVYSDTFLFF